MKKKGIDLKNSKKIRVNLKENVKQEWGPKKKNSGEEIQKLLKEVKDIEALQKNGSKKPSEETEDFSDRNKFIETNTQQTNPSRTPILRPVRTSVEARTTENTGEISQQIITQENQQQNRQQTARVSASDGLYNPDNSGNTYFSERVWENSQGRRTEEAGRYNVTPVLRTTDISEARERQGKPQLTQQRSMTPMSEIDIELPEFKTEKFDEKRKVPWEMNRPDEKYKSIKLKGSGY